MISTHPIVSFHAETNPAIIFLALPALALAGRIAWQRRDTFSLLCVAWFIGTYVPFVIAGAPLGKFGNRDSYIYYMVIVLPAIYFAVARLLSSARLPRGALLGYAAIVAYWFVTLYPFHTWSGG